MDSTNQCQRYDFVGPAPEETFITQCSWSSVKPQEAQFSSLALIFPQKVMLTNIWVPGLCEGSGCSDPCRTPRLSGREAKEHQVQKPQDNCRLGAREAAWHCTALEPHQRGRIATTDWEYPIHRSSVPTADRTTESAALYHSVQQSLKKKTVSVGKILLKMASRQLTVRCSTMYFHLNVTSYTLMFLATHYFQFC